MSSVIGLERMPVRETDAYDGFLSIDGIAGLAMNYSISGEGLKTSVFQIQLGQGGPTPKGIYLNSGLRNLIIKARGPKFSSSASLRQTLLAIGM